MSASTAKRAYGANNIGIGFLAMAAGSADVIAFLLLGHVFASAMTGNAALLGIAVSEGDLLAASQPLTALAGFIAGGVLASALYDPRTTSVAPLTMLRNLFLLEILCLAAFAILWQNAGHPPGGVVHYGLILLSATAMGIQGIAAKRINAPGLNTIVFTSTLVAIVLSVTEILLGRTDSPEIRHATKRQAAVFAAYAGGALLAGLVKWGDLAMLPWLPLAAVVIALTCYEAAAARPRRAV